MRNLHEFQFFNVCFKHVLIVVVVVCYFCIIINVNLRALFDNELEIYSQSLTYVCMLFEGTCGRESVCVNIRIHMSFNPIICKRQQQ